VGRRRHDPRQLRVTVRGWERGMRLQHRRIERRHRVAPTNRMTRTTTPTPPIRLIRMSNIYRLKPFVLRRPWMVSTIDRTSGFTFLAYVEVNPITVGARVTACGPNRHKALAAQERSCISRDQHTNGQPG
jgi:hypothetical protein